MRIRKSVSAVVATVIVAALFSGTAGSMTVVAHAESISNKSQTVTLATQALSDRNDLAQGLILAGSLCTEWRSTKRATLRPHDVQLYVDTW